MPWLCVAIPLLVAISSSGFLAWLGITGWPGEMGVTATMFCERFRDGVVQQPANTWSNVGFIGVGIWIGIRAMRDRYAAANSSSPPANRMAATNFYPALYASLAVFLGPGSAAMHASTTAWGGHVDVISMFIWISFGITYGFVRLYGLSIAQFALLYSALAIVLSVLVVLGSVPLGVDAAFGVLIVSMIVVEVLVAIRRPGVIGSRAWLFAAAGLFLAAFAVWIPSRTGGPLCAPDSLIQGHAVWHLLDSGAVACIFVFYRSERPR